MERQGVDYQGQLLLRFRRAYLAQDEGGHNFWREEIMPRTTPAEQTAILICDMWDNHWSRGAGRTGRGDGPPHENVIATARAKGVHIIHAPSDTMDVYAGTPARRRVQAAAYMAPPTEADVAKPAPPLPIDDSDEGSDTGESET